MSTSPPGREEREDSYRRLTRKLSRRIEPGTTLEVGATYRIVQFHKLDRSEGHKLGDIVEAVDLAPSVLRPYVYSVSRPGGDEQFWLACYGARGSSWVTGLELVADAPRAESGGCK